MADHLSKEKRSQLMARIRSTDTGPERAVRSLLHRLGYRFRLYRKDLPGSPDIVLPRHRTAILVHGCFWHRHQGCSLASVPATRKAFWREKFERNVARDRRVLRELKRAGWHPLVVWECELRNPDKLERKLLRVLLPLAPLHPSAFNLYPSSPPRLPRAAEERAPYGEKLVKIKGGIKRTQAVRERSG